MVSITKDLRSHFDTVRDQGSRPTCIAFALSDTHGAVRPPHNLMSVEHLYFHAVKKSAKQDPHHGVSYKDAIDALNQNGQGHESEWPYMSSLPSDLSTWNPNKIIQSFKSDSTLHTVTVSDICSLLDQDRPSVIVFQPSTAFHYVDSSGLLPSSHFDQNLPSKHAVVSVGYGVLNKEKHILLRNSWGPSWGDNGHAWLSENYLTPRLISITTLQFN